MLHENKIWNDMSIEEKEEILIPLLEKLTNHIIEAHTFSIGTHNDWLYDYICNSNEKNRLLGKDITIHLQFS